MIKKLFGGHEKGAEDDIFRPKKKGSQKQVQGLKRANLQSDNGRLKVGFRDGSFVVFADQFSIFS